VENVLGVSLYCGMWDPVMAECLNMICFQVVGNDVTVSLSGQAGQMELNVMTPVMAYNILNEISLLTNYLSVFEKKCVRKIKANEKRYKEYLNLNPSLATLLSPKIGYLQAAEIAKESFKKGISVEKLVVKKGILTKEDAKVIFGRGKDLSCKLDDKK